MWLPSDEPKKIIKSNLKKTHIPDLGYIRVLDEGNESILFIKEKKIVGAWHLEIDKLEEYYEDKAMTLIDIRPESSVEIYNLEKKLFETILELNEESKLSLPLEIDLVLEKYELDKHVDRENLLKKYRIQDPSSNDLDVIIKEYKIGE
jgi:hypothetical protein